MSSIIRQLRRDMNTSKFYDQWAITYDTDHNRTRDLDEKVLREVLGAMRVPSILELGCGTGKNTLFLAQIADNVEACDFSENMIGVAKTKVQAKNVRFLHRDITSKWSQEDKSVDLLVCNLVLEHVEDLEVIFREAHRVLRDEGLFFLSELHPFRQYQGVKANFAREGSGGARVDSGAAAQASSENAREISDSASEPTLASRRNAVETEAFISEAFVHHVSDFLNAAGANRLALAGLNEWWHETDEGGPPRLITFLFKKGLEKGLLKDSGTSAVTK